MDLTGMSSHFSRVFHSLSAARTPVAVAAAIALASGTAVAQIAPPGQPEQLPSIDVSSELPSARLGEAAISAAQRNAGAVS
jgi:hypothetical protein